MVSLSSLCAQMLLAVWSEAAEAMPAVVAGWLAGKRRAVVSLSSLCVQLLLLSVWSEAAEAMPAVVAGWLAREEKS